MAVEVMAVEVMAVEVMADECRRARSTTTLCVANASRWRCNTSATDRKFLRVGTDANAILLSNKYDVAFA
jgi:hypothetical protein